MLSREVIVCGILFPWRLTVEHCSHRNISGFINDFPSHDEDVRTERLLSELLLVSLGVHQGCVLGPGTFYPRLSSNVAT